MLMVVGVMVVVVRWHGVEVWRVGMRWRECCLDNRDSGQDNVFESRCGNGAFATGLFDAHGPKGENSAPQVICE